jgi:hypothetical protein
MPRIMNKDVHFLKQINYLEELVITADAQNMSLLLLKKLQVSRKDFLTLVLATGPSRSNCFLTSVSELLGYISFLRFPRTKITGI